MQGPSLPAGKFENGREPSPNTWLGQLASLTRSVLVSETSSIKDSELLKLDIEGNSYKNVVLDKNLIVGTTRAVEVSVHQERSGVTSAITEQAPTQHTMVAAAQCTTALTYAPMPVQGTSVGTPMLVQSTCLGAPMLVQGTVFPPVTCGQCPSRARHSRQ